MLSRTTSALITAALISLAVLVTLFGIVLSRGQSTPHGVAPDLFEAMEIQDGDWAADVGSGSGTFTIKMAREVGPSGRVFAVDIDAEKLRELNEEVKEEEGVKHITTVYSVHDNPMLPDSAFDAMLVRNAYHEFMAPDRILQHLKTALEPGGRLVMAESVNTEMVGKSRDEQTEEHDIGIEYAREELKAAGFEIERETSSFVEAEDHHHWLIVATRPTE
jgi:ubiquinone/menaquinone biosynthesis C-methylase UbiE